MINTIKLKGEIKPGYGVASGKGNDERYPDGTLRLQFKYFLEKGLDLSRYYMGTINLDISPCKYQIGQPKYFFENINWSDYIPPENFYFSYNIDATRKHLCFQRVLSRKFFQPFFCKKMLQMRPCEPF